MAYVRKGRQMTRWGGVAVLLLAVSLTAAAWQSARAEEPQPGKTNNVIVRYDPPSNPSLQPFYMQLKQRQVLERLQGFMAPLRLPKPLTVRTAQCGAETVPYVSGGPVTICYELVQHIAAVAFKHTSDPKERAEILYGTFVEAVLHQVAYAVFDELQVPIWGREDDAADRLAALIMVEFGDKVALTTILGTAKFFEFSQHTWTGAEFASAKSPAAQRFYNFLCIAYGADPITFHFLKPRPGPSAVPRLPEHRAVRCRGEYIKVRHAFNLRIMPYVDPDLMVKVRASQWLRADEMPEVSK